MKKKNQKSAQCIQQVQKKLDSYTKKLRELETKGIHSHHHRQPREVLRDMGHGLKYDLFKWSSLKFSYTSFLSYLEHLEEHQRIGYYCLYQENMF